MRRRRTWIAGALAPIWCALAPASSFAETAAPSAPAHPTAAAHPAPPKLVTASHPPAHAADPSLRRQVAGGPTAEDVAAGVESPELRMLREAERELFPPALTTLDKAWPSELPAPLAATAQTPRVHASGLPPATAPSAPPTIDGGRDLAWLSRLDLPDLPIRWDARLVRYLEFYRDDPRGRQMLAVWHRRAGRYAETVRRTLRRKGVPEDLFWLAMIESGFDPAARSPAGALGLWQFMPETGRAYGLPQDRWADQRMNVVAATEAAADFLSDLQRRFGSWELAIASYNMGYLGVLSLVRRYNTNDFWALSKLEGTFPWETTLYVPKVLAAAIVGRNPRAFGLTDLPTEPALDYDEVDVPAGTSLAAVAQAAGCPARDVEMLNLELRASRTPPASPSSSTRSEYTVKVPSGRAVVTAQNLSKTRKDAPPLERYVVRFGETLEQIAAPRKISVAKLVELNAIAPGEVVRGGTILFVPPIPAHAGGPAAGGSGGSGAASRDAVAKANEKPAVVVPRDVFVYPDRRRVFYRVLVGDTLRDVATAFHVSTDDLRRWNDVDPAGRLVEGMTLQVFVPAGVDLARAVVLAENDVRVVPVGSDEFFALNEERATKPRQRTVVAAKAGDTIAAIGKRYGLSPGTMERINRRGRGEILHGGESIAVYVPIGSTPATPAVAAATTAKPTGANAPATVARAAAAAANAGIADAKKAEAPASTSASRALDDAKVVTVAHPAADAKGGPKGETASSSASSSSASSSSSSTSLTSASLPAPASSGRALPPLPATSTTSATSATSSSPTSTQHAPPAPHATR